MTRRTFVLLVCRVIGLVSLCGLVSPELVYRNFAVIGLRDIDAHDGTPVWVYAAAIAPLLFLVAGIVLAIMAPRVAGYFPASTNDFQARGRLRFGIVILVGYVGLAGIISKASQFAILSLGFPARSESPLHAMLLPNNPSPSSSLIEAIVVVVGCAWLCRGALRVTNQEVSA